MGALLQGWGEKTGSLELTSQQPAGTAPALDGNNNPPVLLFRAQLLYGSP